MKLVNFLSFVCISGFGLYLNIAASNPIILSVINKSGATVQISYLKTTKGPLLKKLIEQSEVLTFGNIEEAMISGVGIIGKYTTPEPFRFFPIQGARKVKHCIAIIEGTKNRSLTKPFGDWNIKYMFNKFLKQVFPSLVIPKKEMIIDAFPTVVRMGVPTPRFILGLPEDASVDDAIAAENMLTDKWSTIKTTNSEENQTIIAIIQILSKAREAFERNKPDEVLQDLVTPRSFTIAFAE